MLISFWRHCGHEFADDVEMCRNCRTLESAVFSVSDVKCADEPVSERSSRNDRIADVVLIVMFIGLLLALIYAWSSV